MYAWLLVIQMKNTCAHSGSFVVSIEDTCENKLNRVHLS